MSVVYQFDFSTACVLWPEDLELIHYPNTIHLSVFNQSAHSIGVQISDIFIACLVVLVINMQLFFLMYIRIVQDLSKRKRSKVLQTSAALEKTIHQASVMVIVNGSVFFVCYSILVVRQIRYLTFSVFEMQLFDNIVVFDGIADSIFIINASVNPLIYLIVNQRYRHAFISTLKNICQIKC